MLLSTPEGENRAWRLYRRLGFTDVLRNYRFTGDPRPFGVLGRDLPLAPRRRAAAEPAQRLEQPRLRATAPQSNCASERGSRLASWSSPMPPMFNAAVWNALTSNVVTVRLPGGVATGQPDPLADLVGRRLTWPARGSGRSRRGSAPGR